MPDDNRGKTIVVLDFDIGGMTVVKAIREINNTISVRYIADNAFFPCGRLDMDTLTDRIRVLAGHAIERFSVPGRWSLRVTRPAPSCWMTCGSLFLYPFVGVVPPVRTAGEVSRSRVIGLLATEGTVKRPVWMRLLKSSPLIAGLSGWNARIWPPWNIGGGVIFDRRDRTTT